MTPRTDALTRMIGELGLSDAESANLAIEGLKTLEADLSSLRAICARVVHSTSMRRNPDWRHERARFLEERGWRPIPFTPKGAPIGFIAHSSHPYQKWAKEGHERRITEQALKAELIADTNALAAAIAAGGGIVNDNEPQNPSH